MEIIKSLLDLLSKAITVIKFFRKSKKESESDSLEDKEQARHDNNTPINNLSSTTLRLQQVVGLISEHTKYPPNKMARKLGLTSERAFRELLDGTEEASFELLESFALKFGVNENWLISGEGAIFTIEKGKSSAEEYIDIIEGYDIKLMYLIRDKFGRTGIILKLDEWDFKILGKYYHLNSKVGVTGQNQIKSFYNFLNSTSLESTKIGIQLDEKLFERLFSGYIPPKILEKRSQSNWYDDFLDYDHKCPIAKDYGHLYGSEFLESQEILKYKMAH